MTELIADWPENLAALVRHADPKSFATPRSGRQKRCRTGKPAGSSAATALRDAALLCQCTTERTGSLGSALAQQCGTTERTGSLRHAYETETLDYGFDMVERSLYSMT